MSREFFGRKKSEKIIFSQFDSVPLSMFTIFRCAFGDCNTGDGLPIPALIVESDSYGAPYAMLYCAFVFFVTIGLFNIISAIFVDSTMSTAAEMTHRKMQDRMEDEPLWSTNVAKIIKCLLAHESGNVDIPD